MKSYVIRVDVGDAIEVGRFRNVTTKIKDIKKDANGQPVIVTTNGTRKLLSCRLNKLAPKAKDRLTKKYVRKTKKPRKVHAIEKT